MCGPSNKREHASRRDEQIVGDAVVAPGPAQPERVPGVEDLELLPRYADDDRQRARGRLGVRSHEAAGEQDAGVVDAAAIGPAAADEESTVRRCRGAARGEDARGDPGRVGEQLLASAGFEPAREQAAGGGDRDAPAGRGVAGGDCRRVAEQLARRQFQAAGLAGRARVHEARAAQPLEKVRRKAALRLRHVRKLASERCDLLNRLLHGAIVPGALVPAQEPGEYRPHLRRCPS